MDFYIVEGRVDLDIKTRKLVIESRQEVNFFTVVLELDKVVLSFLFHTHSRLFYFLVTNCHKSLD